jgi:hypothetical protein
MKFVKIAFLLMTVFLVLTLASCDNHSENASDGLVFGSNRDGTCVLKDLGSCKDTDIVIPSVSPDGKKVVGIAMGVFDSNDKITSVTIPSTVVEIFGANFIGCNSLERITVDSRNPVYYSKGNCLIERESKTLIAGCYTSVIPDGVVKIASRAFCRLSSLTSIEIPDSVKIIDRAFYRSALTKIVVPAGVEYIEMGTFSDCADLVEIFVDADNPVYYSEGNCLIERESKTLIAGCYTSVIPNDVKSIATGAFEGCNKLENITIPEGIKEIGPRAFANCDSLVSVDIPNGVTTIGINAFAQCDNLTTVRLPDSVTSIGYDAFSNCPNLCSVNIPKGITCIQAGTFGNCKSLNNIVIPDSVLSIEDRAFGGCISLERLEIPQGVTNIGNRAFWGCQKIESLILPEGLTEVSAELLGVCHKLTQLHIPASVTTIEGSALFCCCSLSDISFGGTMQQWEEITKKGSYGQDPWYESLRTTVVHCTDGDVPIE